MNYSIFHNHSFFSCLDGFSSVEENCQRAKELGINLLTLTDHGNVNSNVDLIFYAKKMGLKYCCGTETYVTIDPAPLKLNRYNNHQVIWAKDKKNGLKNLWKMVGLSNHQEYFYYRPRIQLENWISPEGQLFYGIEEFAKSGGLMSFSGHQGSTLEYLLWADMKDDPQKRQQDMKEAYRLSRKITDPEYYRKLLKPNWLEQSCEKAFKIEKIFGKGNFFIEIQNEFDKNDELPFYNHIIISDCMREVAKNTGIMPLASCDAHYAYKEEAEDQRVLLLTNMRTTFNDIRQRIDDPEENESAMGFFTSTSFYMKSYEEMKQKFTQEELDNTNKVADQIEQYSIEEKASLPTFEVPEFKPTEYKNCKTVSDDYLMRLCIDGAIAKKPWLYTKKDRSIYWERIKKEVNVIFEVGLSDYFLMVYDICKYCDNAPKNRENLDWQNNLLNQGEINPIPRGPGRGSSCGSIVSYLISATKLDPIEHGLFFERFYNKGRNKGNYISYPDFDADIAASGRDHVIRYLKWKYKNVASIITFALMKGRSSLKDCFRVKNSKLSQEEINKICDLVGVESKIISELEEAKKDDPDFNTLKWTLLNSEEFRKYYEDPHIKDVINSAVRCENTIRGQGKHASGILVYPENIEDNFPTCYDPKTKESIVSVTMGNLEKIGGIKLDILGISVLDRLKLCQDLVNAK